MRTIRGISAALLLAILSGCGSPLVRPGAQTVDGLALSTPVAWSDLGHKGQRLWTRDGASLNALRIYSEIKPGEHVLRQRLSGRKTEGARFRAGLSAIEVVELIVEGLGASGVRNVQASELRPARWQNQEGFRADIRFASASGLLYQGMLIGAASNDRLSYALYTAPAEHYFERDHASVEAIFASLESR